MNRVRFSGGALVVFALTVADPAYSQASSDSGAVADRIRTTERARLHALVEANLEVANQLHADDFQLINPRGGALTKEQYLGGIASGELDYLMWEADAIEVRVYGEAAVIRYQAHLEIVGGGQNAGRGRYWHIDVYEKRNGHWQVVRSQATGIPQVPARPRRPAPHSSGQKRDGFSRCKT